MMINDPYKKKDEQLFAEVQKLKDGDFSNSNAVYELSEKYIYKIINDIVKNHHTTEDLMQEAYIQIYNKIGTLQEVKAFYVWAGRIATNLTLRYIQKNSKEVLATADEEGDTDFIFDTASEDNEKFIPESVLVDREKQRLIAEIIDKLSTEQKICIQYFYYEEMSVNQIAEEMGCSTGTIKSRLNYARKSIKEAVVELDEKHGTRLYSLASAPLFLIIFRAAVEGLLPVAVAGAASAAAVGGASVATGTSSAGSAASVGGSSVTGSAGSATTATSAANAGASAKASGIEEVKNLVLEKLKKIGGDIKSDAKKATKATKQIGQTHKQKINAAFELGKKEGFKQIIQSGKIVIGTTAKGFGTSTLATKVVTLTVAGALVATPVMDMGVQTESQPAKSDTMTEREIPASGAESNGGYDGFYYMGVGFSSYNLADGRKLYQQGIDLEDPKDIEREDYPKTSLYQDETFDLFLRWENGADEYYGDNKSALSEESVAQIRIFGESFAEKEGHYTFGDEVIKEEYFSSGEKILLNLYGEDFIFVIKDVYTKTGEARVMSLPFLIGTEDITQQYEVLSTQDFNCYGYLWPVKEIGNNEQFVFEKAFERTATDSVTGLGGEKSKDVELEETIDINDPKYATTHPGAYGLADPSETANITMPDIESYLPTVEEISDMEAFQSILYEKYALFNNVTDEIVYERMSEVPCTVYLDDGSVHSITLGEFMFKDWSGYADLDRVEYDEDLAQEIFSSYTKWTDSLIE